MLIQPASVNDTTFTLDGLQHIRLNPMCYVPNKGEKGLTHQARAIIENSIEELEYESALSIIGKLHVTLCEDFERDTFQLIISDNGRGIPLNNLLVSLTKLNTSGKILANKRTHGVGAKTVVGLSRMFRCLSYRSDGVGSLLVQQGVDVTLFDPIPSNGQTGLTVVYEPDPTIFTDIEDYADEAHAVLIKLLKPYVSNKRLLDINLKVFVGGIPEDFWTLPTSDVITKLAELKDKGKLFWSSDKGLA